MSGRFRFKQTEEFIRVSRAKRCLIPCYRNTAGVNVTLSEFWPELEVKPSPSADRTGACVGVSLQVLEAHTNTLNMQTGSTWNCLPPSPADSVGLRSCSTSPWSSSATGWRDEVLYCYHTEDDYFPASTRPQTRHAFYLFTDTSQCSLWLTSSNTTSCIFFSLVSEWL